MDRFGVVAIAQKRIGGRITRHGSLVQATMSPKASGPAREEVIGQENAGTLKLGQHGGANAGSS